MANLIGFFFLLIQNDLHFVKHPTALAIPEKGLISEFVQKKTKIDSSISTKVVLDLNLN